jgi:hypothetical protein
MMRAHGWNFTKINVASPTLLAEFPDIFLDFHPAALNQKTGRTVNE